MPYKIFFLLSQILHFWQSFISILFSGLFSKFFFILSYDIKIFIISSSLFTLFIIYQIFQHLIDLTLIVILHVIFLNVFTQLSELFSLLLKLFSNSLVIFNFIREWRFQCRFQLIYKFSINFIEFFAFQQLSKKIFLLCQSIVLFFKL